MSGIGHVSAMVSSLKSNNRMLGKKRLLISKKSAIENNLHRSKNEPLDFENLHQIQNYLQKKNSLEAKRSLIFIIGAFLIITIIGLILKYL